MEDFYVYTNSQNKTSNVTFHHHNDSNIFGSDYDEKAEFIMDVVTCVIIGIGLPLTLVAIYALYSQVRKDHVGPIYVINLLISDLIQLCCLIGWVAPTPDLIFLSLYCVYYAGLVVSVCFMVCIALERYLAIAHPLWYRCHSRNIKTSMVVCVLVWVLDLVIVLIFYFWVPDQVRLIFLSVFLLLPFPLFIFFLGGTLKSLSTSISVPSDEKRRIVAVLVLVLLIYTLLFLPNIISDLSIRSNHTLYRLSSMFLRLSPLADLTLYVFMRKGAIDKLLSSVCCCSMGYPITNQQSQAVNIGWTQTADM